MKAFCGTIVVFIFLLVIPSCKTSQKSLTEVEIINLPKVLEFSKSACRGKCPHFELTVYKGGWLIFEGKRFTEYEGKTTGKLSSKEYEQLIKNCREADLWTCEAAYGMNIMDIPTTRIHFYEADRDKEVKWRLRAPESLPKLSNQIMELVYLRNWVKPNTDMKNKGAKLSPGILDNEIIVQFKEWVDFREWCALYDRYGVASKRIISEQSGIYLIVFDTALMEPDRMLGIVRKDSKVKSAEFNKRIQPRNR